MPKRNKTSGTAQSGESQRETELADMRRRLAELEAALAKGAASSPPGAGTTPDTTPGTPKSPLFKHRNGQWCKKVRGIQRYFGTDEKAALAQWDAEKEDWLAGRVPRRASDPAAVTVADCADFYLDIAKKKLADGDIVERSYRDRAKACERACEHLGRWRAVSDLTPNDFARLRAKLKENLGAVALGVEVIRIRGIFATAFKRRLIPTPPDYGDEFAKPKPADVRRARNNAGPKSFTRLECLAILAGAKDVRLRAMVLLGLNAALGNRDLAALPLSAIDFESGWLTYPRPKTAVMRRIPLWPETLDALQAAIKARPEPKQPEHAGLVFLTRTGAPWVKHSATVKGAWADAVGLQFGKLLRKLKLKTAGRNFYSLRHTCATEAENGTKDRDAVAAIMGHTPAAGDMLAGYRERIDDARLRAAVDAVRLWLWPNGSNVKPGKKAAPKKATKGKAK